MINILLNHERHASREYKNKSPQFLAGFCLRSRSGYHYISAAGT